MAFFSGEIEKMMKIKNPHWKYSDKGQGNVLDGIKQPNDPE